MSDLESIMYDAMIDVADEAEYNHWYTKIVEDFKTEVSLSFFEDNKNILEISYNAQDEAKKLIDISPSGTILFTFTAIETAIKNIILQPIIYGMTHNKNVADLIVKKFLKQSNVDAYTNLAFDLLEQVIDLKLSDVKTSYGKLITSEIKTLAGKRNNIIHSGVLYNRSDAEHALNLLKDLHSNIIIVMLRHMGFTILDRKICKIKALTPNFI